MTTPNLILNDISFAYSPERPVLRSVSLSLGAGERVGLVGSNGSGKTTLMQIIVGLLRPTSGTIEAFGAVRRVERDFHEVRRRVGLVFQDSDDQLFCPTVYEDVAFGPLNLGLSQEDTDRVVRETLADLDLAGYEERITYRLSQGEKRLVALATVLAMRPRVLLLDEPTAGLDAAHEARLTEVLLRLPQEMVVISHDRKFLDAVATRHAALKDGAIVPVP